MSIIDMTYMMAIDDQLEFITPEMVLDALLYDKQFCKAVDATILQGNHKEFQDVVLHTVYDNNTPLPEDSEPTHSEQYIDMFTHAEMQALSAEKDVVDVPGVLAAMMDLTDSWAANLLEAFFGNNRPELLRHVIDAFDKEEDGEHTDDVIASIFSGQLGEDDQTQTGGWHDFVMCINDHLKDHNPLIGREAELERTIQVLCRKDKNNPLHLGEPGVGKTSIVYGLAQRIEDGNVPDKLKGFRIYSLDMGTLLAGTQFRGDFEKRIKDVMKGIADEGNAIVYIDEIHNIVGAGRGSDGTLDASNMLKPYLEGGDIRFIGATIDRLRQPVRLGDPAGGVDRPAAGLQPLAPVTGGVVVDRYQDRIALVVLIRPAAALRQGHVPILRDQEAGGVALRLEEIAGHTRHLAGPGVFA